MTGGRFDLSELAQLASDLVTPLPRGAVVWLSGDLGSGKTAFVRAALDALGGVASSPTYALVHEYAVPDGLVYHVDCYRLRDPEEAIDIDFAGLVKHGRLLFVEWPERASEYAPPPDVHLRFSHVDSPHLRLVERAQ